VRTAACAPAAPTRLAVAASAKATEVALAWDPPRHTGGLPLVRYRIAVTPLGPAPAAVPAATTGEGERWEILCDAPAEGLRCVPSSAAAERGESAAIRMVATRLRPNSRYRFSVRAENAHGRSAFSKSVEART
jgi:hypothetical protein